MISQKERLIDLISKYNSKIPLNEIQPNDIEIKTNSWFGIKKSKNFTFNESINLEISKFSNKVTKCKKIVIKPTIKQRIILLNWMNAYRLMYNATNHYILSKTKKVKDIINSENYYDLYNFRHIRTHVLKNKKKLLVSKYNVPSHILDGAIKLACTSYRSAYTSLKNKKIKNFRVRYIKKNKKSQMIDIEKGYFTNGTFCKRKLGNIVKNDVDFDYSTVTMDSKLHYNKLLNQFTLLIPQIYEVKNEKTRDGYISIDAGTRTFLTCLSNKNTMEIGYDINHIINKYHDKMDDLHNKHKNGKIKSKALQKCTTKLNRKMSNRITDLHWKSINYLVNENTTNIIIGKWSTKCCVSNKKKQVISKKVKRTMMLIRFYDFLQKLKYKCECHKITLHIINESYTSKLCSMCGNENKKLGGSKIYKCDKCMLVIDRDLNGCRNILMKNMVNLDFRFESTNKGRAVW